MSCNCTCNTTSKCNNDPCAICTPPGVTGLTTCQPVDPCDEKVNIECIKYNGVDFSCFGINVTNGDSLISVLLAILNYYFPPDYCCELDGTLTYGTTSTTTTSTTTSTTSTTSTSTSTTTTTTTATPCICYKLTNNKTSSLIYSYVDCITRQTLSSSVPGSTIKYQCAVEKSIIQGELIQDTVGPCSNGCPTTTTTTSTSTTTTTTTSSCLCFKITNDSLTSGFYRTDNCVPGTIIPGGPLPPLQSVTVCSSVAGIYVDPNLSTTIQGNCPCTTSTTTTSTTTTTTTIPCNCYKITNSTDGILYYSYTECGSNPNNLLPPSNTPIAPGDTEYVCAVPGSFVVDLGLDFPIDQGPCSLGCPPLPPPPDINCTLTENFVVYNGSSVNIINDLTGVGWYTWAGGPVLTNNVEKGVHSTYSGSFGVDITVSPGGAGGCIKVLVNGVEQDSATVLTSTVYTLNVTTSDPDCVQIILTDDPC